MNKPIYIIGAGAVGTTLAVFLQSEGRDVRLIRGRSTVKAQASELITVQLSTGEQVNQSLAITMLTDYDKLEGTVVITAKSYGNEDLACALSEKAEGATIVLLQNGLGIEQPFLKFRFSAILRCVLFLSSQYTAENKIKFKPVRPSAVGMVQGRKEHLTGVVADLTTTHFPFIEEPDIQPVIWKKAIINSVFNSIGPLLDTEMGIFHREPEVLQLGIEVIKEGIAMAGLKGISLLEADVVEQLLQISRASDGQLISTLQDIRANRPTEIDTLNLAIARIGQELGKEDMVQQNALLGNLVWWKSALLRKEKM